MLIKVADTTISGDILHEISIQIENELTTLREIITNRVTAEVEHYNSNTDGFFKGLVQPNESEKTLNGYKVKKKTKAIDGEKQAYIALDAFTKNGFFVLVNDKQETELDTQLLVTEETSVQFVKLTQLVGG